MTRLLREEDVLLVVEANWIRPYQYWLDAIAALPDASPVNDQTHVERAYIAMCALLYPHQLPGEDEVACLKRLLTVSEARKWPAARSRQLLERYTELFPAYAWTDEQCAIDLMTAEIVTLRKEAAQPVSDEREEVAAKLESARLWLSMHTGRTGDVAALSVAISLLRAPQQQAEPICPHVRTSKDGTSYCELAQSGPQQAEPTDEQLEAMVEAYVAYQSPADKGLAQQMEGMRLALQAIGYAAPLSAAQAEIANLKGALEATNAKLRDVNEHGWEAVADCEADIAALKADSERLEWVLPILSGDDTAEANGRALKLAGAVLMQLSGRAAIDAARKRLK